MTELEKLQQELQILKKEKNMVTRVDRLRQTTGSIRANFVLYIHEITARYDDKVYITGSVKDSFYIKPRDERTKDDKGSTYSNVHLMFRKSTIDGREFPSDFVRKGDIVEIDALLTHGYQKLTDSEGNIVMVDGKEKNIPTQPQYEGYYMKAKRLTDETKNEYKSYLDAVRESHRKKKEENETTVEKKTESTTKGSEQPVNTKPQNPSVNNTQNETTNEPNETLELGDISFDWNE